MVSRRTKAIIGWFFSIVLFVQQIILYRVGNRYAAAVEAGEKPSKDELEAQMERWVDQSEQSCSGQQCTVSMNEDGDSSESTTEKRQMDDIDAVDRPAWKQMMAANYAERYGDEEIAPRWVAVGFVRGISVQLAYDYDVFGVGSSTHRRLLWGSIVATINKHILRDGRFSRTIGGTLGTICYRTVYGLLREPPGNQ